MASAKYEARANAFVEALDLARVRIAAVPRAHATAYRTHLELLEHMALHPARGFVNVRSLAYLEADFFTFWNEATGKHVDAFWRDVARRGLPFERKAVKPRLRARGR